VALVTLPALGNGSVRRANATRLAIFGDGVQQSETSPLQSMPRAHPNIGELPGIQFPLCIAHFADYFGDPHIEDRVRRALHEAPDHSSNGRANCGP